MRSLSSGFTFLVKYVVPPLVIGVVGWATLDLFIHPATVVHIGLHGVAPAWIKWWFLVAWFVGSAAGVRQALPLKRVCLEGDVLVISNYFTEHRLPLSAIVDVRQGRWFNRTVTIELADPNPFNGTVTFMPVGPHNRDPWHDDPIVTELRRLAGLDSAPPQVRAT